MENNFATFAAALSTVASLACRISELGYSLAGTNRTMDDNDLTYLEQAAGRAFTADERICLDQMLASEITYWTAWRNENELYLYSEE